MGATRGVAACGVVSPTLRWNPTLDEVLVGRLTAIWVDATNAGGALGFLAPVRAADVAPAMARVVARVQDGLDDVLTVTVEGEPVGWVLLERDARTFSSHWRTVKRLQVDPRYQGRGLGRVLLDEVHRFARDELELEFLVLTVRGGTGTDDLYNKHGYQEVGRIPGAMRVGPGDDRDEILMMSRLSETHDGRGRGQSEGRRPARP